MSLIANKTLFSTATAILSVNDKVRNAALINVVITIVLMALLIILRVYDVSLLLRGCVEGLTIICGIVNICLSAVMLIMQALADEIINKSRTQNE